MEEKLIEAVRLRKILYDTSDPDYMKSKLKTAIWDEISKDIGMKNGYEAKTLWEKLRHSLRDALRRQRRCMKSGAAAWHIKPWKLQKEMEFLQPYMTNRRRDTNLSGDSDNEVEAQDYEQVEREDVHDVGDETNSVEPENVEPKDDGWISTGSQSTSRESSLTRPQKMLKKSDDVLLMKQTIPKREERTANRAADRRQLLDNTKTPNDPLYHFFMSMYEMTKLMPPPSQHIVRNDIYKAVTDMEATLLNIPQAARLDSTGDYPVQPQLYKKTTHKKTLNQRTK